MLYQRCSAFREKSPIIIRLIFTIESYLLGISRKKTQLFVRTSGENPKEIRIFNNEPQFIRPKNTATRPILMEAEVKDFVDSILSENTKKTYIRALELLEQFTGKTISQIIKERREDFRNDDPTVRRRLEREIEKFYVYLISSKKMCENSAYAYVVGIKSIMGFYDVSLKLKKVKRVPTKPRDWVPSIDELRQLYEVADLRERALVALALNVPLRINDFSDTKKSEITPFLNATEFPASFIKMTTKKKALMACFITEDTINLLRTYIKTLKADNPFLFQGRGSRKLDEDSINRILRELVKDAQIDTLGLRVRFHLFRKVFIGVARSMIGLSDDQIKMLTGKRVKEDMSPYYVKVKLKPLFERVAEELKLIERAIGNDNRIDNVETMANLVGKALANALLPELKKLYLEQQKTSGDTIGFIEIPNFDAMSPKTLLEQYIELKEHQKLNTSPREASTLADAVMREMDRRNRFNKLTR